MVTTKTRHCPKCWSKIWAHHLSCPKCGKFLALNDLFGNTDDVDSKEGQAIQKEVLNANKDNDQQ